MWTGWHSDLQPRPAQSGQPVCARFPNVPVVRAPLRGECREAHGRFVGAGLPCHRVQALPNRAAATPRQGGAVCHLLMLSDRFTKKSVWLGREGSNLRMTESKSVALPLGDAPTWRRDRSVSGPRKARTAIPTQDHPPKPTSPHERLSAQPALPPSGKRNNPKQVAPDPLMRASRHPAVPASVSSTSPITGISARAGASRSFRACRSATARLSTSRQALAGNTAAGENPADRDRNTAGVDTATPGLISTIPTPGTAGTGTSRSPMPDIIAGRLAHIPAHPPPG